ncbi:laminin subunit beta-4 isoform X4 [Oryzias melastigma]|uniref:laminin subunit beta-4 isoform X4 n=1 Tax=Oryzias melastigma TaxID=30732 RepID=UPI00168D776E|nr:laminin subunit beta-4 isoform X4 [Oryzias melastigma]
MKKMVIFLAVFFPAVHFHSLSDLQDQCPSAPCEPPLGDLMVGRQAQLKASSTCGLKGPEQYCTTGHLQEARNCFLCDSQLPYSYHSNRNSHWIENIIMSSDPDKNMSWWQSQNGVHQVSIQLDLETVFQFSHLVLTFKSFRPAAMVVERSKDFGQTWKIFRFFADDCALHFPSVLRGPASSIADIICDSRFSGPEPSTGGEVVLQALDPMFEIADPHAAIIQDLISMTNIRLNFTRLLTLKDTLPARRQRSPVDNYYYALFNMVIRGSCFCNGHATQCMPIYREQGNVVTQSGKVHGRCVCHHNTAGHNCERCQEFHHDTPWSPGGETSARVCRKCNCHGHSEACHFDAARYQLTGGVSGGVCDNCQHYRTGAQCERCQTYMYQDPEKTMDDPRSCIPCDCDPDGSHGGGLCDALTGQCFCKENVEGWRCDRCKQGFFGLRRENPSGCYECHCHTLGSVASCDPLTGNCKCDSLAYGPHCDRCVTGFWGLGNSTIRCSPCDCDIGGAHNTRCSSENGQCHCLPNMIGRTCSEPAHGHFLPPLNYFLYEAELAAPLPEIRLSPSMPTSSSVQSPKVLPPCEQYFKERGFDFSFSSGQIVLVQRAHQLRSPHKRQLQNIIPLVPGYASQIIPGQKSSDQKVKSTGLGLVRVLEGTGLTFTVDNLPSSMKYHLVIHYEQETLSDWLATISIRMLLPGDKGCSKDSIERMLLNLPDTSRAGILDSPVCLNAGALYLVEVLFYSQPTTEGLHILVDSMGLIPSVESIQDCSQKTLQPFHCTGLAISPDSQESLPEVCERLIKSLSARIHYGATACECNLTGSLGPACSKLGGFCECKPNVIGRCCDTCAPLTFGFGSEGCERKDTMDTNPSYTDRGTLHPPFFILGCECDPRGSSSKWCDQVEGQCMCYSGVVGRRCDHCKAGFWGFPYCRPCECGGRSETCHGETGACVNCREHTTGGHCDRCAEGYYGNPISRQPCQPCLCPGTLRSGHFFATSCQQDSQSLGVSCDCLVGHTGSRCEICLPGFFGDLTAPGFSHCRPCLCNSNTSPDDLYPCDRKTGECLHCLHNTSGPQCQACKPGYYGNALTQDCKECSCYRKGTVVSQCPAHGPCFCNPRTGQCPCRRGTEGDLCDRCEDGYWDLDGWGGCQPCSCHPEHSMSNKCDKVTGQCHCHPEFGGQQCNMCGENYFGSPELQCFPCDCHLEGTERPSCDPETGECICGSGISGILCDECSPGYDATFPACKICHSCASLWAEEITDVQKAARRMKTFIPQPNGTLQQTISSQQQRILDGYFTVGSLVKIMLMFLPRLQKLDKLCVQIRMLKDSIDTNTILIDPSALLFIEIHGTKQQSKNLLNNLKDNLIKGKDEERDVKKELLLQILKHHKSFMLNEEGLRNFSTTLENSMDTRHEVLRKLSRCSRIGALAKLEQKVKDLSVVTFNHKASKRPCLKNCSVDGAAPCVLLLGGPDCDGGVSISHIALSTLEKAKDQLIGFQAKLQRAEKKIYNALKLAQTIKDHAKTLQTQLISNAVTLQRKKTHTRDLFQRAKLLITDNTVSPDDIKEMATDVLSIHLSLSPDEIWSVINVSNNLTSKSGKVQYNLTDLKNQAAVGQGLLHKVQYSRQQTAGMDIKNINIDIFKVHRSNSRTSENLTKATGDQNNADSHMKDVESKLDSIKSKLEKAPDLSTEIKNVKDKTEQTNFLVTEATDAAEDGFNDIVDAQGTFRLVMKLFWAFKKETSALKLAANTPHQLTKIAKGAKDFEKEVEDKFKQTQDVEQRIKWLLNRKKQKELQLFQLLKIVYSLRQDILSRVVSYSTCSS